MMNWMLNKQDRLIGMRKSCVLAAVGILVLSGCTSTQSNQSRTNADSWITSHTLVGEAGKDCSGGKQKTSTDESAAALIAVPFVASLAKQGLNAIGVAFQAAGQESEKSIKTPVSPMTLAMLRSLSGKEGAYSFEVVHQALCVRVVVAEVGGAQNVRLSDSISDSPAPNNFSEIEERVKKYLGKTLRYNINTVHLYAEYYLEPQRTGSGEVLFVISPKLIWYNRSISGARYSLAAINFKIIAPGESKNENVKLAFLHDFSPNGLSPGSIRSEAIGALAQSGYLPAPALSDTETKTIQQLNADLLELNKLTLRPEPSTKRDQLIVERQKFLDRKKKLNFEQCAVNHKKTNGEENSNAQEMCENDLAVTALDAEIKKEEDILNKKSLHIQLNKRVNRIGKVGYYNAQFEVIESRRPNELYLAVAKALTESKNSHESSIDAYIKERLAPEDKPSKSVEDGDYLLALYDYDKAEEALEIAKIEGNSSAIAGAERELIVKYNDLRKKAEKAGRSFTLSPPYP